MNDKMLLTELKSIENKMDFIDGIRGDYWGEAELCFWCGTTIYNGSVGVVHHTECPKYKVRERIEALGSIRECKSCGKKSSFLISGGTNVFYKDKDFEFFCHECD